MNDYTERARLGRDDDAGRHSCAVRCATHPGEGFVVDCWRCEEEYWQSKIEEGFNKGELEASERGEIVPVLPSTITTNQGA